MIIFLEGLPRAGKSYEACSNFILGALKQGRPVDAYIEGLNHEQFAQLAEISIDQCKELLVTLTREQVPEIYKHARKDALVVLDELQNFWPTGRQKLDPAITKFITEHGHEGQDLLCMGQDMRDCHALWRRRVAQKTVFIKRDAIGQESKYTVRTYKATSAEKFELISSKSGSYDPKYFGLYKSHSDGTNNFNNFKDERANIWGTKTFLFYIPLAVLGAAYAVWYLVGFFDGGMAQAVIEDAHLNDSTQQVQQPPPDFLAAQQAFENTRVKPQAAPVVESLPPAPPSYIDYFDKLASNYRLRLGGVIQMDDDPENWDFRVQVMDSSQRVQDIFRRVELESMGWKAVYKPHGLIISKGDAEYLARPYPLDVMGRVPSEVSSRI